MFDERTEYTVVYRADPEFVIHHQSGLCFAMLRHGMFSSLLH